MAAPDYYALLGVPRNATTAEVRKAFRGKALEQHPDRGGDEESFRLLSKAYDVLSDQERRKYYDRTGRPERTAEDDFLDGFGKKSAAPATVRGAQVAQGGQTPTNIQVPRIFTTAFGDPGRLAERAAAAEARKAEVESQLIPTPARFAFAFGRPDILAERRAERLAK